MSIIMSLNEIKIQLHTYHVVLIFCNIFSAKSYRKNRCYSHENLEQALRAVLSGVLSQNKASSIYGVPQKTISRKIRKLRFQDTT